MWHCNLSELCSLCPLRCLQNWFALATNVMKQEIAEGCKGGCWCLLLLRNNFSSWQPITEVAWFWSFSAFFNVLTLISGQIFKPALYPEFLTLMYSLMCNPLQPAGIRGLLSCLLWHLHPYSPSCLCSRDKAVLCALAYTAAQLDIADCSVNIQTCNLLFSQYFKGNCNWWWCM